jgi:uncharacterized protein (TIGR00730 family)
MTPAFSVCVYCGSRSGALPAYADVARQVGNIPKALQTKENTRTACTELHVVGTMHERKQMMAERADVFLALPGGIGTFEEFFEVWTWRQLGYHDKPIGLLNTAGYYDGLLQFAQRSVQAGFLSDWQMDLIRSNDDPIELIKELVQAAGFSPEPQLADL